HWPGRDRLGGVSIAGERFALSRSADDPGDAEGGRGREGNGRDQPGDAAEIGEINMPLAAWHAARPQAAENRAPLDQYISSLPPAAGFFSSFGTSDTSASLVSRSVETLAAFCRAERTTFVGSMMPSLTRSQYLSSRAS